MSGYFMADCSEWAAEHYRARWTAEDRAPRWWAALDCAWSVNRPDVPSIGELARLWGWPKSTAYRLFVAVVEQRIAWEKRADERRRLQALIAGRNDGGTIAERSRNDGGTIAERKRNDRPTKNAENPADGGTIVEWSRNDGGTIAERLTRARSDLNPTPTPTLNVETDRTLAGAPSPVLFAAPVEPPPAPPTRPPKPAKERKPAVSRTVPGYHEAIRAWDDAFRAAHGTAYPWVFRGRLSDAGHIRTVLAAARYTEADAARALDRIAGAARAYLASASAGAAYPKGEPPTVRWWASGIARWLQTDPSAVGRRPADPFATVIQELLNAPE